MVVKQFYRKREDGVNLFITFSDEYKYIIQEQTGIKYVQAIDVEDSEFTYIESDEFIPEDERSEFPEEPAEPAEEEVEEQEQ